jgi:hypothetical protein
VGASIISLTDQFLQRKLYQIGLMDWPNKKKLRLMPKAVKIKGLVHLMALCPLA